MWELKERVVSDDIKYLNDVVFLLKIMHALSIESDWKTVQTRSKDINFTNSI